MGCEYILKAKAWANGNMEYQIKVESDKSLSFKTFINFFIKSFCKSNENN